MEVKLNLEFGKQGHRVSLDEFTNSLLEAIRRVVRQELDRLPSPQPVQDRAHPEEPQAKRALAVSKAEAAQILGISLRTIDYCIALKHISVLRVGRRVLIPIKSLEAVVRRGAVTTRLRP